MEQGPKMISHGNSAPPPSAGQFAYNTFVPAAAYTDPIFGQRVQRITSDHGRDDIYARNMWWSADSTRYLHRTQMVPGEDDAWDVIEVATGRITHRGIPFGTIASDGGFDPIDPDVIFTLRNYEIQRVRLKADGSWEGDTYLELPAPVLELGGSINWLDAVGRCMLVRYGGEPSVRVYGRGSMTPYANPIDATNTIEAGSYLGLSPDGNFVVGFDSRKIGASNAGKGVSWALDHSRRQIAPTPTAFWSLCGDHGSFISASDGRNYMVTYNCYGHAGLWRADITNNAEGLDEAAQMALPNNKELLPFSSWYDFGHVSTVARGDLRDWAFLSTEDSRDVFNGPTEPWHPYRQEIIAVNVVTGEIRRLAHHRSRSMDYDAQPRLSASWDGAYIGFASNFNQPEIVDVYAIPFGGQAPPDPIPPPATDLPVTITLDGKTYVGTVREQ